MGNVTKLPHVGLTPRELIDNFADEINQATSITLTIRNSEGCNRILWSHQQVQTLLYAVENLRYDALKHCFGDTTDG